LDAGGALEFAHGPLEQRGRLLGRRDLACGRVPVGVGLLASEFAFMNLLAVLLGAALWVPL